MNGHRKTLKLHKNGANTKSKKAATSASWKPGQSGNPNGRPRDGESWASVLTWASNLTGEEAAKIVPQELARFFRPLKGLQLKQAIVLRIMAALLFDPSSALFNAVLDRIEGKVPQPVDMNWRAEAIQNGYDPERLFTRLVEAGRAALDGESEGGSVADTSTTEDNGGQ